MLPSRSCLRATEGRNSPGAWEFFKKSVNTVLTLPETLNIWIKGPRVGAAQSGATDWTTEARISSSCSSWLHAVRQMEKSVKSAVWKLPLCLGWPGRKAAGPRSFSLELLRFSIDIYLPSLRHSVLSSLLFPSWDSAASSPPFLLVLTSLLLECNVYIHADMYSLLWCPVCLWRITVTAQRS